MDIEKVFHSLDHAFGDPISAYIFILALKVLSFLVRNNKEIKGLNIFDHLFLIHNLCR